MLVRGDETMKQSWKPYVLWILVPEAAGALSGWLAREGMELYAGALARPPLSPPGPVFPVVWVVLYVLMGVGAARVWSTPPSAGRSRALGLFFLQLAFNFCWSIFFFRLQWFGFALLWLAVLWVLILAMLLAFRRVDRPAGWLQLPYLLWVAFAAYLNLGVWLLNK